jgi:hypothetical protein
METLLGHRYSMKYNHKTESPVASVNLQTWRLLVPNSSQT